MADTEKELLCPACGEKMKKIYIENQNINVDICVDGCGGIFFDNRELEKVDEPHENAYEILQEIENKTYVKRAADQQRICPVCGTKMMKMGAANGDVEIDVCAVCGGKFLDAGELQSIRNIPKKELDDRVIRQMDTMYKENLDDVTFGLVNILDNNILGNIVESISKQFKEK